MRRTVLLLIGLFLITALGLAAMHRAAPPAGERASGRMVAAAQAFLDSLTPELREQALFSFTDDERKDWSNLPHVFHEREGVRVGALSPEQRRAVHRLLQTALSSQGYLKATGIMYLDEVLKDVMGPPRDGQTAMFGYAFYWIGLFGTPAADSTWGWQLDGHHLALNFTVVGNEVAVTPAFMGSEPAEVNTGLYAGWRILGDETDRAFTLMHALTNEQRVRALLSETVPPDIFTGPGRGDQLGRYEGLRASEMTEEQRHHLVHLIETYVHNLDADLAEERMAAIHEAGFDSLYFAWMGSTNPGEPIYYRIHGPAVLIEFDNSQNVRSREPDPDPNHIHTVWRDPGNDYGEDLLRKHYEESPHH